MKNRNRNHGNAHTALRRWLGVTPLLGMMLATPLLASDAAAPPASGVNPQWGAPGQQVPPPPGPYSSQGAMQPAPGQFRPDPELGNTPPPTMPESYPRHGAVTRSQFLDRQQEAQQRREQYQQEMQQRRAEHAKEMEQMRARHQQEMQQLMQDRGPMAEGMPGMNQYREQHQQEMDQRYQDMQQQAQQRREQWQQDEQRPQSWQSQNPQREQQREQARQEWEQQHQQRVQEMDQYRQQHRYPNAQQAPSVAAGDAGTAGTTAPAQPVAPAYSGYPPYGYPPPPPGYGAPYWGQPMYPAAGGANPGQGQ